METKIKYVVQRLKEYSHKQFVTKGDDLWEDINWDSDHDTQEKAEERVRYVETRPVRIIMITETSQVVRVCGVTS